MVPPFQEIPGVSDVASLRLVSPLVSKHENETAGGL